MVIKGTPAGDPDKTLITLNMDLYVKVRIRNRMSFIDRYVYTYEEFVSVTEASGVQQQWQ